MSNYVNLMDVIYPVGSIYQSMSSTSPASTIGGTWEQIKTFLYGSTSAGSTGGEATHTLTNDEMPKHRHTTRVAVTNGGNAATYRSLFATNSTFWNGGSTIDGSAGWDWNNPVSNQGGGKLTTICHHIQPASFGTEQLSCTRFKSPKRGGVVCLTMLTSWMLSTQLGQCIARLHQHHRLPRLVVLGQKLQTINSFARGLHCHTAELIQSI